MKLGSVFILSIVGILNAAQGWSQERPSALRYARICDPSGCYLAWRVVDSDHDGVCDADELMAGTDPYDPLSKPSLIVVAEIAGAAALPSFEAGFGAFVVFPEKLQTMLLESQTDALSAFPLKGERGDALSRLGISAELMGEHGVDPTRDGLTVGLDKPVDGDLPAKRVGGIDIGLISYGSFEHGTEEHCCYPLLPIEPDAEKTPWPAGGMKTTFSDGSFVVDKDDGSGFLVDKDGFEVHDWYMNPDADQGSNPSSGPTPEEAKAFVRLRGAVIRPVEGWSAPDFSGTKPQDRRKLVILVDPEYAENTAFVFDPASALNRLNLSEAQPDRRPDLPSPGLAAPGGKDCTLGCP
jgi:hypothetical protein